MRVKERVEEPSRDRDREREGSERVSPYLGEVVHGKANSSCELSYCHRNIIFVDFHLYFKDLLSFTFLIFTPLNLT